MGDLNLVDIILLTIFFLSALFGYIRGFISEIISLITLIAAFTIATLFSQPLAKAFTHSDSVQSAVTHASGALIANPENSVSYLAIGISFAVLFIGVVLAGAIIKLLLNSIFQFGILGVGNRLLGTIFGLIRGLIINLVVIFLVQLSSMADEPGWQQSHLVRAYQPIVVWLGTIVSPRLENLKAKFEKTIKREDSETQS